MNPEQQQNGGQLPAPGNSGLRSRVSAAVVVAVAALVILGWQWYDSRSQIAALQQELARRLAEADSRGKETRALAVQTQEAVREAQIKLGLLESKLAESQNQQVALEALYQELSRNRDESALAEVEQILLIASQQLQLAGNVKAALIALQNADNRLQRIDRPQLTPLRKVINRDIERLKAAPYVDTVGISVRLDNLIAAVDALPLAMEMRPEEKKSAATQKPASENFWARAGREAWGEIKQLVRIQNMQRPEMPLLTPAQTFFLRENLKLRLLSARLALLARDEVSFRADLKAASGWINRYYDGNTQAIVNVLGTLKQLQDSNISIELPSISASLDAVRNLRLARDRGAR